MKLAIDIAQSLLLPKLEKDVRFDANQTIIAFWETFTSALLDFEKDAKPVCAAVYSLELKDAEKIISKLDTVYISLIKELAENHVLGISSEAIDYLITSKNSTFEKEVSFYTDLQNAITKVERERIKKELPKAYEKLSFELSDDAIATVISKKERETLKTKMISWDRELYTDEETPQYSLPIKQDRKVFSLSWIQYAVAACLVLGISIWYYADQNQGSNLPNKVVTTPVKKDTIRNTIKIELPKEAIAEVLTVTKSCTVINSGLGYIPTKNTIKIVENNQKARMESIVAAIEKYRQLLEKEFPHHTGAGMRYKSIQDTINTLQKELASMKEKEKHYVFDGKELVVYVSTSSKGNAILFYEDSYYLKRDTSFFKLSIAKQPQLYTKETQPEILNNLNKMIFDNGE